MEIDEFQPARKSMELYDETGRGNLQAVYGTHDGLWAMFFAIIDRPNLQGSIRNGVTYFKNQAGEVVVAKGKSLDDGALLGMDWYVEGVQGKLPK